MTSVKQTTIALKLLHAARPHLRGEEVLAMFRGHTGVSPLMLPLLGSILFKPRAVIVTESSVVTLQQSVWSQSTVVRLVSRYACGSVPVDVGRWGMKIGNDDKVFASLGDLEDMQEVARLVASSGT
jgi:hypothetical protein